MAVSATLWATYRRGTWEAKMLPNGMWVVRWSIQCADGSYYSPAKYKSRMGQSLAVLEATERNKDGKLPPSKNDKGARIPLTVAESRVR